MTLPEAISPFLGAGFAPEPHAPHFGQELSGVSYLRRTHTYVSLVGYLGHFTEAVWEVYLAPKNTRRPKGSDTKEKGAQYSDHQFRGFVPVETRLLRTREELDSVLERGTPPPSPPAESGLDTVSHSAQTGAT